MAADVRAAAAGVIQQVLSGRSLDRILALAAVDIAARDRALLAQLCYGCLRLIPRLQAVAGKLLDRPLRSKDGDVQALILLGLYQLHATRIPPHAAVAATVDACRALQKPWARGVINAVLRRFQREQAGILAGLDPAAAAAHPAWLYATLAAQWPAQLAQLLESNNSQPPMTLRVNLQRSTRTEYLAQLTTGGQAATVGALTETAIYLEQAVAVEALPGFFDGAASVQDEAAQLAAILLDAQPGERVLDACAAPGGKSCHILERQPALGELVAIDNDATRLEMVGQNLQRLRLSATLASADASSSPALAAHGSFHAILVDAPCSASGVIRRHPDIKVLRAATDLAGFARRQGDILDACWDVLQPGGRLLYVTCSLFVEENSDVVSAFLARCADAREEPLRLPTAIACARGQQLLPSVNGPDGLYFALLRRAI